MTIVDLKNLYIIDTDALVCLPITLPMLLGFTGIKKALKKELWDEIKDEVEDEFTEEQRDELKDEVEDDVRAEFRKNLESGAESWRNLILDAFNDLEAEVRTMSNALDDPFDVEDYI